MYDIDVKLSPLGAYFEQRCLHLFFFEHTESLRRASSMSSLSDHVERLTRLAKSINAAATAILASPNSGLFTTAVLQTPLEDLIRDVDPSELGLFTLQTRPGEQKEELGRVAFSGATPLRKNVRRREEGKRKEADVEPEVYAQAALKYLDRLSVSIHSTRPSDCSHVAFL
jgi:hypothetical protein